MTSRRRQIPRPIKDKCKQCGREKAETSRTDGLGKSCAKFKAETEEKLKNFRAARDKK